MAVLEVRNLTKRFGGLLAVDGLDFDIRRGEILGMIGPNGAGKSTTFNLIAGAYPASGGEVRFDGEPILGLPPHRIAARGILRTFQHNRPFVGMSVVDNVLVGAHTQYQKNSRNILSPGYSSFENQIRRRAEGLLEFVGLESKADATTLSFGQGRLLEIARALAGEPKLLMLDEPAAGLTSAELARVAGVIRGVSARGIAVLLIEHDMHFLLPLAHRVVVLNFGAKIADGLPDEIRSHPAVADAYLGSHAAAR
jgi:ABC-type branched-subunit amino acid transport system ATPase component